MDGTVEIIQGDNLAVMKQLPEKSFDLIYTDPWIGFLIWRRD